jgi:hypothetical protein
MLLCNSDHPHWEMYDAHYRFIPRLGGTVAFLMVMVMLANLSEVSPVRFCTRGCQYLLCFKAIIYLRPSRL